MFVNLRFKFSLRASRLILFIALLFIAFTIVVIVISGLCLIRISSLPSANTLRVMYATCIRALLLVRVLGVGRSPLGSVARCCSRMCEFLRGLQVVRRGVALLVFAPVLVPVCRHGAPHSSLRSAARRSSSLPSAPS